MESLRKRILEEGRALSKSVLKVDSFLNHAVDPKLMYEMGTYFKEYFKEHNITSFYNRKFWYSTISYDSYANEFAYGNFKKTNF